MIAVGIKKLKNKLSAYIRLVESGETVLVTDHDQVVAELSAPRAGRSSSVPDALLADLVRQGLVSPALVRDCSPPPRASSRVKWSQLQRELDEDREGR